MTEIMDIALLAYTRNNNIHSSHDYTSFQIITSNLNYKINLEDKHTKIVEKQNTNRENY